MRVLSQATIDRYRSNGWWGETTLGELFRSSVLARPDAVALVDPSDRPDFTDGDPQRLGYAQLDDLVDRLAARFEGLGLGADDIVAVQLPNVVELAALYLVAARTGIVLSPLPVQYREYELTQLLDFMRPAGVVTCARIGEYRPAESFVKLADGRSDLRVLAGFGADLPAPMVSLDALPAGKPGGPPPSADDVLTLCWTSGTEGRPKGVPRSHNEWLVPAYATVDAARLETGAHVLNPFPMVNMAGIGGMLVPWLLTGGKLVMHQPLNLPVFLHQIAAEAIHYTVAPPALLTLLLKNEELLAKADLGSIVTIGSGSAPLSPWMVKEWQDRLGIPVINFFGSNEGATFVSGPDAIPDPEQRAAFFPRFGASGFGWPDRVAAMMESRLVDPETDAVVEEPGVPGEMRIKGAAVFSGYYRDPDRTAAVFDEQGFYRTGDLFEIAADEEGPRFYRFVGRAGDVINRGGMKIVPEELEVLLAGHPAVAETAVVGYPDDVMNERACVVVVPREGAEVTLDDLRAYLEDRGLGTYKLPEKLLVLDRMPRNPVGKLLKNELRERAAGG